ncbi:hypothetical protein C0J52_08689 [Blattella germanica]|nr:hypothetical protein C0J52_08689 [Blattella germanica]
MSSQWYFTLQASEEQNVPKEVLYKTVHGMLDEIGYNRHLPVIRWLGLLLLKVLKKTCNGLCVNEAGVNRLMSAMGDNPVIFAPSHRSYGDFILLSYICFHYKIQIPAIAAGMDFHSMWLMGRLLRDSCAFFMRRSFGSDKLYWTTFSEYVQKLVTDGEAAVEFFIEGTRSRSAKSLVPKFGFLSMTLVPFFTGRVPDITIVPINISYDRTLEEVLFAYELLGVPKPKETTSGFLKALNMLNERYGKVHMDFAEPLSVKEMFHASGMQRRLPTPSSPQVHTSLLPDETAFCMEVGHRVVQQQQRHSVLSAFNLMAVMLNNSVLEGTGPPLLTEVIANISWFKSVMEVLGALVDIQEGMECGLRQKMTMIPSINVYIHLIGHNLSHQTMDVAVPMVMLQHYVNPCLHYLVGPAMITLILRHLDDAVEISRDSLKQLEALSVMELSKSGGLKLGNHRKLQNASCPCSESQLLKATQKRVEELLTSSVISHPYSLSLDMHSAALQALTSLHAVTRLKKNGSTEYLAHTDKLLEITEKLENLILPSEEKFHLSDASTKHFVIHGSQQAKL